MKTLDSTQVNTILDWVIFSGTTSEGEIAAKFNLKPVTVRAVLLKLTQDKLIKMSKTPLGLVVRLNLDSEEGQREKARFTPSKDVVGEEKHFKTNLDILKDLVDRFSPLQLGKVARYFGTSEDAVESWAKLIHDQGLIVLYYPIVGETVLLKSGSKPPLLNSSLIRYIALMVLLILAIYWRDGILRILGLR